MDKDNLQPHIDKIQQQVNTMQFSTKDNFSQLMATDNYLEKYLPFKI